MFTFDPVKCHILSFKTDVWQLCKFHVMKDERLASKMKGKTNFSRRLKQVDGLTWLIPSPSLILRQIYGTVIVVQEKRPEPKSNYFSESGDP